MDGNAYDHVKASLLAGKSPAYVQSSGNGLYTGFVHGVGFRANVRLPMALAFIREATGLTSGAVPCFDEVTKQWISELDLAPGA